MGSVIIAPASVAGTVLVGRLAQFFSAKSLFIAASLLGITSLALLGHAAAMWQIVVLTANIWFAGAIMIPLVNVVTGSIASDDSRGQAFALINLAYPLGTVFGGVTVGQLVAWQGDTVMFTALAVLRMILPILGLATIYGVRMDRGNQTGENGKGQGPLGRNFTLLLLAFLLSAIAVSAGRLGTSLSMQSLGFSAADVASTATVSGLVAVPVTLLMRALSDRLGHRRFLMAGYMMAALGAVTLSLAVQRWHFWLAATLLIVAFSTNFSVAAAFAASFLPAESLSRGLPRINAMDSVASVVRFCRGWVRAGAVGRAAALPGRCPACSSSHYAAQAGTGWR